MSAVRKCCILGCLPGHDDSGHNNQYMDYTERKVQIRSAIIGLVERTHVNYFLVSMEPGIGQSAAEVIIELKKRYPYVKLECVIPYEAIADEWPSAQREKYFTIMEGCDRETMLHTQHTGDSLVNARQHLIDRSQFIIAVGEDQSAEIQALVANAVYRHKIIYIIDIHSGDYSVGVRVSGYETN